MKFRVKWTDSGWTLKSKGYPKAEFVDRQDILDEMVRRVKLRIIRSSVSSVDWRELNAVTPDWG